jgi:Rps23 Pro-64 3,4-dihydroxylase Tpa1-like proline 4-hydroxylase
MLVDLINGNELIQLGKELSGQYQTAKPFPNIVIDDAFPKELLNGVLEEFPSPNQIDWLEFKNKNELKLAARNELQFGSNTRSFIHFLNSGVFISFLEQLTGIKNLIPDPNLEGGGLHQILKGGLLKIHADFNKHPKTGLDRRLNVLVYLNKDWEEGFGGHFELWNNSMTHCEKKILPLFNRMAIFSTTSTSYHGHPDPLNCPEDRSRKSIAIYYYTNGRPESEILTGQESHDTLFQPRAGFGENTKVKVSLSPREYLKLFIPPIVVRYVAKWKAK